jgi:Cytochrome c551/c552
MWLRSLLIAGLLGCGTAHAADAGRALAQRSVCLGCHQVDVKRVGPSFRDIALRYGSMDTAVEYLARAIREGSRGLWGAIPMPAQRHLDPATATQLAAWIVSLAPDTGQVDPSGAAAERPEAAAAAQDAAKDVSGEGAAAADHGHSTTDSERK